jgi:hypothetical protein
VIWFTRKRVETLPQVNVETTTSLIFDVRAKDVANTGAAPYISHNLIGLKILRAVVYRLHPIEATMKFSSFALTAVALASSTNGFVAPGAPRFTKVSSFLDR